MNKLLFFLLGCFALVSFCWAEEDNNEFFEIDARKIYKDLNVKFGAGIYNDINDR